jgi:hypothetical protein
MVVSPATQNEVGGTAEGSACRNHTPANGIDFADGRAILYFWLKGGSTARLGEIVIFFPKSVWGEKERVFWRFSPCARHVRVGCREPQDEL